LLHELTSRRKRTGVALMLALLLAPIVIGATREEDFAAPYRILRDANRTLSPDLAASAYADGAKLIFEQGERSEMFQGKSDIRYAFERSFGQVDPGTPIKLEFRFPTRVPASERHSGAYRLVATVGGKAVVNHGAFTVRLTKQDGMWRFAEDRGRVIAAEEFESLPPADLDAPQ